MGDFLRIKLIDAAKRGDLAELEFCFDLGNVDVNGTNESGCSALCEATKAGSVKVVERLLKCEGIDVNLGGKDKKSPLFIACQKGMTNIVKLLLQHPTIDVNTQDKFTTTAFMVALRSKFDDILVMLLLKPELDINQQKNDGTTALMYATNLAHTKVVNELLRRPDVDIDLKNKKGETAHDIAERKKLKDIIFALDNYRTRKNSRRGSTRSRVFSSQKNFRDYNNIIRGSSFLSESMDDDLVSKLNSTPAPENSTSESKTPGKVLSSMIKNAKENKGDSGSGDISVSNPNQNAAPPKSILVKRRPASNKTIEVEPAVTKVDEKLAETAPATKKNEIQEIELPKPTKQVPAEPKEVVPAIEEALPPTTETSVVETKAENKKLVEQASPKEEEATDAELAALAAALGSDSPKIIDVCFIAQSVKAVAQISNTDEVKSLNVFSLDDLDSKEDLESVFSTVEWCNYVACVISSDDFFKSEANLAALAWAFIKEIKVTGLNLSEGASKENNALFKMVLRLGHGLLGEESWERLKKVNIDYPQVYDAIEHLSKNMVGSVEALATKLSS